MKTLFFKKYGSNFNNSLRYTPANYFHIFINRSILKI